MPSELYNFVITYCKNSKLQFNCFKLMTGINKVSANIQALFYPQQQCIKNIFIMPSLIFFIFFLVNSVYAASQDLNWTWLHSLITSLSVLGINKILNLQKILLHILTLIWYQNDNSLANLWYAIYQTAIRWMSCFIKYSSSCYMDHQFKRC